MKQILEGDWKILKKLKDQLLENFCSETLNSLKPIIEYRGKESYKSYKKLWEVLKEKDDELSLLFDDLKRSTAIIKLVNWKRGNILSEQDFKLFSKETQDIVNTIISI